LRNDYGFLGIGAIGNENAEERCGSSAVLLE